MNLTNLTGHVSCDSPLLYVFHASWWFCKNVNISGVEEVCTFVLRLPTCWDMLINTILLFAPLKHIRKIETKKNQFFKALSFRKQFLYFYIIEYHNHLEKQVLLLMSSYTHKHGQDILPKNQFEFVQSSKFYAIACSYHKWIMHVRVIYLPASSPFQIFPYPFCTGLISISFPSHTWSLGIFRHLWNLEFNVSRLNETTKVSSRENKFIKWVPPFFE